ncbi:MAG: ABC transporter ATP-binding protein [Epsilonproteobacteria bacterium]|nr:ABC transporter ATP-binding protein [Campylobacterota bacterium]
MIEVDLKINYKNSTLVDIDFIIDGKVALVGESGSGKSLTLKALIGMLPSSLDYKLEIKGSYKLIRGESVSFVPQNPFTALSPRTKISKQWFGDKKRAKELFDLLKLPWELFNRYPPHLSGGQLQRVIFAMALESNPSLLLLDEPTTALDASIKEEIIDLLRDLQKRFLFDMLFVTHEINLAAKLCEKIIVIKDGKKVEEGNSKEILSSPKSLYTKALIEANFANREFRS